ncbi:DNA glycosylase AlkZ-like family protein [Fodinicola feengrottensis]
MAQQIDRRQVLAYRIAVQQLDGSGTDLAQLAVLDLGLPDINGTAAQLAASVRLRGEADFSTLERVWSFRGSPYYHRPADLRELAGELWPLSESDAQPRLGWQRKQVTSTGTSALDALTEVAEAMFVEVSGAKRALTKGMLSTAVTARIRPELSWWCAGCKSTHVSEQLMRLGGLPAGLRLEPESSPLNISALPRWPGVPAKPLGVQRIIDAYLRLYGPAAPADVAGYLGTTRTAILPAWPTDLVQLDVSGRSAWLPDQLVDVVRAAKPAPLVRLLGAGDPYLQSRDRDVLVPDKVAQKAIWRILGNPGAVLVDGEIVGTWRAKQGGKSRTDLTVTEFGVIDPDARDEIAEEARRITAMRGVPDVRVTYVGG